MFKEYQVKIKGDNEWYDVGKIDYNKSMVYIYQIDMLGTLQLIEYYFNEVSEVREIVEK